MDARAVRYASTRDMAVFPPDERCVPRPHDLERGADGIELVRDDREAPVFAYAADDGTTRRVALHVTAIHLRDPGDHVLVEPRAGGDRAHWRLAEVKVW
jgi:hypothetical protein